MWNENVHVKPHLSPRQHLQIRYSVRKSKSIKRWNLLSEEKRQKYFCICLFSYESKFNQIWKRNRTLSHQYYKHILLMQWINYQLQRFIFCWLSIASIFYWHFLSLRGNQAFEYSMFGSRAEIIMIIIIIVIDYWEYFWGKISAFHLSIWAET